MKQYFARPRPTPKVEESTTKGIRTSDLRSMETNCSMPSGDAAQAALFTFMAMQNFPKASMLLGGPLGSS